MEWRGRAQRQPFDDLHCNNALDRFQGYGSDSPGRQSNLAVGQVTQKVMDFLVAAQAVSETGPARTLLRGPEYRAEQGLQPAGSDQHPGHAGFNAPPVDPGVPFVQVVLADDDGERRIAFVLSQAHAHGFQPLCQVPGVAGNGHARNRQAFLSQPWGCAQRGPEGRRPCRHAVFTRNNIALGRQ